jgi:hypothetical protein
MALLALDRSPPTSAFTALTGKPRSRGSEYLHSAPRIRPCVSPTSRLRTRPRRERNPPVLPAVSARSTRRASSSASSSARFEPPVRLWRLARGRKDSGEAPGPRLPGRVSPTRRSPPTRDSSTISRSSRPRIARRRFERSGSPSLLRSSLSATSLPSAPSRTSQTRRCSTPSPRLTRASPKTVAPEDGTPGRRAAVVQIPPGIHAES